jgi:Ca2+ transporting ATPase|tara:strand:- start:747 stop:1487 length:741 start_codon:yes stop_codon:yes gene_type:complete
LQKGECGELHDDEEKAKAEQGPLGVKDIELTGDYTLITIIGIEDTIRTEVPGAIELIKKAGVTVRMVTGDNIGTAIAIAVKANIITEADKSNPDCYMEGESFYKACGGLVDKMKNGKTKKVVKNAKIFENKVKKLVVVARCRPEDKYLMVTGLRNLGHTVAVTGDGTNDAPALKRADVGFGMGIAGTDTCKEAADILIKDDNFVAIVKAAQWGRNVYDNIQRFLQFQLSVNFVALTVTFVGSCIMK